MGKWTEAAAQKQQTLEEGQQQILAQLAIQDENQMIIMEALADLGMMVSEGGDGNGEAVV